MQPNIYKNMGGSLSEESNKINSEALRIAKKVRPILDKILANPSEESLHSPGNDGRWNKDFVSDAVDIIMQDLYGTVCPNTFKGFCGVPKEVQAFVRDAYRYRTGNRCASYI